MIGPHPETILVPPHDSCAAEILKAVSRMKYACVGVKTNGTKACSAASHVRQSRPSPRRTRPTELSTRRAARRSAPHTQAARLLLARTTGRVELRGAGDHGFRFGSADSQSGSTATRRVSATLRQRESAGWDRFSGAGRAIARWAWGGVGKSRGVWLPPRLSPGGSRAASGRGFRRASRRSVARAVTVPSVRSAGRLPRRW